jgi:hypothetical protein
MFPEWYLPLRFTYKICTHVSLPMSPTYHVHLILFDLITITISVKECKISKDDPEASELVQVLQKFYIKYANEFRTSCCVSLCASNISLCNF